MFSVTVFLGVTILAIFGGIGMVFLPYNLLNDYIYRPKRINKPEWQKRKGIILQTLVNLRNEGKKLEAENMEVSLMKGLTGYCRRFQFNRKLRVWETCTMLAEREFRKLNNQADFNNKVDSLFYLFKLFLSVICGAISLYFVFLVIVQFLQFFNLDIEFLDPIVKMTELLNQED